ncbi:hypothetical protein STANM309S_03845 [Streptomyces tanashiensis]
MPRDGVPSPASSPAAASVARRASGAAPDQSSAGVPGSKEASRTPSPECRKASGPVLLTSTTDSVPAETRSGAPRSAPSWLQSSTAKAQPAQVPRSATEPWSMAQEKASPTETSRRTRAGSPPSRRTSAATSRSRANVTQYASNTSAIHWIPSSAIDPP